MRQRIHREMQNMKKLKHSNIAEIYESKRKLSMKCGFFGSILLIEFAPKTPLTILISLWIAFETATQYCIAMEYLSGGELFDYVQERCGLSDEKAKEIFSQIVKAAQHCHEVSWDLTTKVCPKLRLHSNYQCLINQLVTAQWVTDDLIVSLLFFFLSPELSHTQRFEVGEHPPEPRRTTKGNFIHMWIQSFIERCVWSQTVHPT